MYRTGRSLFIVGLVVLAGVPEAFAADKSVCVDVVLQRPREPALAGTPGTAATPAATATDATTRAAGAAADPDPASQDRDAPSLNGVASLPIGQRPLSYLKRLIEHFVTHEKGFVAVQDKCDERLVVELYPLKVGWTAFARYSGTGREERVDMLLPTELSPFAERVALALLYNKPIGESINRENVLTADSKKNTQRIKGTNHFHMGVGTQVRVGKLGTAVTDSGSADVGKATSQYRVATPVTMFLGYRGKFENWGVETNVLIGIGTSKTAAFKNPAGGHVDFGGDAALQLHFLHYFDPRGLTSFYMGAGATFELLWFNMINAEKNRSGGDRSTLLGGGLDVDLVAGWEFMRASSVQFYLQGELQMPAYALSNENSDGSIHTWFPAVAVKLGVVF